MKQKKIYKRFQDDEKNLKKKNKKREKSMKNVWHNNLINLLCVSCMWMWHKQTINSMRIIQPLIFFVVVFVGSQSGFKFLFSNDNNYLTGCDLMSLIKSKKKKKNIKSLLIDEMYDMIWYYHHFSDFINDHQI